MGQMVIKYQHYTKYLATQLSHSPLGRQQTTEAMDGRGNGAAGSVPPDRPNKPPGCGDSGRFVTAPIIRHTTALIM